MKIKQILSSLLAATMIFGSVTANAVTVESDDMPKASGAAVEQESSGTITFATEAEKAEAQNRSKAELPANIEDGTILHAWCWSFATIEANLPQIAAAGYTAVQTSPVNECNDTYSDKMKLMGNDETTGADGAWWWHYQPVSFQIGNYQLGNETQYQSMCAEAEKWGIKIITDIVSNHTTSDLSRISNEMLSAVGMKERPSSETSEDWYSLFHNTWRENLGTSRWTVVRRSLRDNEGNILPDINTENPDYQIYLVNYLNQLVTDGCDGFRFDTAKHIAAPTETDMLSTYDKNSARQYTTDFWKVVTGNQAVQRKGVDTETSFAKPENFFIYGEILGTESDIPFDDYANYIGITDDTYGYTLRNALKDNLNNFSTSNLSGWGMIDKVVNNGMVTWVESHDTYCNDHKSAFLTDEQIRLAWAAIAARKDGTPLFFNRPLNSNGSTGNYWGANQIGIAGNNEYYSTEVAEVNHFRNAMSKCHADSEYMRNIDDNSQILQIDRYRDNKNVPGKCGTVIVNLSNEGKSIDTPTSMAVGRYYDTVSGGEFEVYNNGSTNNIRGNILARKVAVIYKEVDTTEEQNAEYNSSNSYNLSEKYYTYFFNSFGMTDIKVSLSGGIAQDMTWSDDLHCYYYEYPAGDVTSVQFTVNDGSTVQSYDATTGFVPGKLFVPANKTNSGSWKQLSDIKSETVYFNIANSSWTKANVKVYMYCSSNEAKNAAWPGASMDYLGNGFTGVTGDLYRYTYYYTEGAKYNTIKFNDRVSSDYNATVDIEFNKDFYIIGSNNTPTTGKGTISAVPSTLADAMPLNKSIDVIYKYYDRSIGDPTSSVERTITKEHTATSPYLNVVVDGALGTLGYENVFDNYAYYNSQFDYVKNIASYYDDNSKRNSGIPYGGRINPKFLSKKTSSFGGRFGDNVGSLSVSGENWVTYKDKTGYVIDSDDVLPDLSNVSTVTVWGFAEPKTYIVTLNYPTSATAPTKTVAGSLVTDLYSGTKQHKCGFDQVITGDIADLTPGIQPPANLVFDGWYQITFDGDENVSSYLKVSENLKYTARVTKNITLYAVYSPTKSSTKAASVTANPMDKGLDDKGNSVYRYNTMLNIFNCGESDKKITDVGVMYVNLSGSANVNYGDVKEKLKSVIGNETKSATTGTYPYHYYQYSVKDGEATLTNKNRIQFTFKMTNSQISGNYANIAVFAVYKYEGKKDWIVSENCVQYKYSNGDVIVTEINR